MRLLNIGLTVTLAMAAMAADTAVLKDGRIITGTYLGGSPRDVKLEVGDQIQTLDVADIVTIQFDASRRQGGLEPPLAGSVVLPAGTKLVIRMIDAVDSEQSSIGQTFMASLDEPVTIDGGTVIPRGADVVVKLVDDQESGKLTGRTTLTLDRVGLKVNGRLVEVNTETLTEESSSRGARTGKVAGGTALFGTIIGAIAFGALEKLPTCAHEN